MGLFDNVTYTDDEAGQAAKARNDAISELTDLTDRGAPASQIHLATLKVAAAAQAFDQVLTHPRQLAAPGSPPSPARPELAQPSVPFQKLRPRFAPVVTGEPITTVIFTVVATVFSIFGFGDNSDIKKAVEAVRNAVKDVANNLINAIWTLAHNIRWVLNAVRWLWERVLSPLLDEIAGAIGRIAVLINRVVRPLLDLIQKIRLHILEFYVRFVFPVIAFLQKVRRIVALLQLLHVPGMKTLNEKLARVEGKIIGVMQQIMLRVNDHSGLLNILMSARMVLQHDVLIRSLYEVQGAWVNQWWNSQTPIRAAADAEAGVQLDLQVQAQPHARALDNLLAAGVYASTDTPGPREQELDALLRQGAA